jgi:4-hydroxyphenylpyruvate dioxygenase
MLEIPANYHADLAARFDLDEVLAARMADDGVLYDEDGEGAGFWQMYSRAFDKLFFFEFVQRAKGYGGYGAPNAGVRLAAQNRFRPDAIPAATL